MKFEKEKFNNENLVESLSEKEKQLAREIAELPADVLERVNMLLVWRGLKPWTKLTYIYKTWGAGDPEPDLTSERKMVHAQDFNRLLGFIGLSAVASKEQRKEPSFEKVEDKTAIPGKEYRDYYIAPDLETAQKMSDESAKETEEKLSEELMAEIQKLSPTLYTEMIRDLEKE